jgi:4-amino-4-deoxy-L-arabinose transferase-like glycosyltransferase
MFVVALLLRLVMASRTVQDYLPAIQDHWAFGGEMGHIGKALAEGQGFSNPIYRPTGPSAEVAPVYPALCAIGMMLFGVYSVGAAAFMLCLNSLFSAITCFPVFWLARRVFDERMAIISGWAWVFFPYSIHLAIDRIWENTLSCMVAAFIWWLTAELVSSRRFRDWITWGFLWGAQALVSPAVLITLPFLGGWVALRRQKAHLEWFKPAIAAALVFIAMSTPWAVRNYVTFHRFIPFRDNFWLEMHIGNGGDSTMTEPFQSVHPYKNLKEFAQWMQLGELGYMDAKKVETSNFIREHPRYFLVTSLRRFTYMWTGVWTQYDFVNLLFNGPVAVLMIMGFVYAWKNGKWQDVMPILIPIVIFPIPYYITHSRLSFRHPIDPLISIMMCYGVVGWNRARVAARQRQEKREYAHALA